MTMEYIGYERTLDLLYDLKKDSNTYLNYLPEESQKVLFKQELDKKGKKCINTYLEVYIK